MMNKEIEMQLPDWNSLTNDERTRLVDLVSTFAWPPGNDGQFAVEFYGALNRMLRQRELREDRATMNSIAE
jgi:hypothetical protein